MYSFILRAAPQALLLGLLGSILSLVAGQLETAMTDGGGQQGDMLVDLMGIAGDNLVLMGIAGLAVTFIARAVLEARVGGV